jgi:hypothetical protein
MTIYIDENLPHTLAEGFDLLQRPLTKGLPTEIAVKSIKKTFGQGIADEEWIPLAGQSAACGITQDFKIQNVRHQRALIEQYKLGMIYLRPPGKKGLSYWEIVEILTHHWPELVQIISKEPRPFYYELKPRSGLKKLS